MALGHWLKDYIGPKASANSGGTSPLTVNSNVTTEGSDTVHTLDKTWQEIHDAFPNVILRDVVNGIGGEVERFYAVVQVYEFSSLDGKEYDISVLQSSSAGFTTYVTDDPNGYPHYSTSA